MWAAVLATALCAAEVEVSDAFAREVRIRGWAVELRLDDAEWRASLGSEDWRARLAALEGLARSRPGAFTAEELGFVSALCADPQPNVRATALAVCARFGVEVDAPERFVEDSFPLARLQLVRVLGEQGCDDARWDRLATDPDPDVAWCARIEWLRDQFPGGREEVEDSREELSMESPQPWRFLVEEGERAPRLIDALATDADEGPLWGSYAAFESAPRIDRSDFGASDMRRSYLWCYLVASLQARAGSDAAAPWFGADGPAHEWSWPLPAVPLRGLDSAAGRSQSLWALNDDEDLIDAATRRKGRRRFLEAAPQFELEGRRQLLSYADEVSRGRIAFEDAGDASELLLEAIARSVANDADANGLAWLTSMGLDARGDLAWTVDLAVAFWEQLSGAAPALHVEATRLWLDSRHPSEVRRAVAGAIVDTWARTGDRGCAALTTSLLADEDAVLRELGLRAWIEPSTAGDGRTAAGEALAFAAWSALPREEALRWLRDFDRERAFPSPWREAFLELWATEEGRVVSVPELLARHVGDEEVIAALARWLDAELVTLEAGEVPDEEEQRGPWREAETRARWLLAAWTRATEHARVEEADALLSRVDDLGKELMKLLVPSMVRSEAGDARLARRLDDASLTRRTRVELALLSRALLGDAARRDAARIFLLGVYPTSDEELRRRILVRMGELDGADARRFLEAVVFDAGSRATERVLALDALSEAGAPETVRAPLLRVALEGPDLDLRREAIRALGARGDADSLAALRRMLREDPRVEALRDELLPAIARLELRLDGALSALTSEAWRAGPVSRAARELEARFRGERLPSSAFVASEVLEVAEALVERGALRGALPPGWWAWDARLLLELGAVAAEGRGPGALVLARDLYVAALAGLRGEGSAADRDGLVLEARARLLVLALALGDWRDVEGWAEAILVEWRSGRTSESTFHAVLGPRDRAARRMPTSWLRAARAAARAHRALAAGDFELARVEAARVSRLASDSQRAARLVPALEAALPPSKPAADR